MRIYMIYLLKRGFIASKVVQLYTPLHSLSREKSSNENAWCLIVDLILLKNNQISQ